ncbi:MAG: 50S ribosomal protein L17 [Syntrophotalea acetylenica]|jgi:large subunit ribosomal protein L17|uniref:Large ribosomal subunit protein bL17 n=1 Tax=Syntrophotalea acetylenica TaxID=29542 RepID=A0A1L3GDZ6_SYNAC|nr:50S ribosomal protein L17 [Syntrophotalea acetylenica]APG44751.1 50S ribosomal protein L17 [Syntrophotalea acetylenica]MDD4456746.1 50S ribosomal protein L17 [Syntrophotalea acetylenica]
MRHNKSGKRLGRNSSHRAAMMRNMVTSLLEHEKITTTDARAKELRKVVDRMITLGKRGDLHARRQASQVIRERKVVGKLFEVIGPRFKDRPGGYTRIIKLANRLGDNASQVIIELVEEEFSAKVRKTSQPAAEVVAAAVTEAADASSDEETAE